VTIEVRPERCHRRFCICGVLIVVPLVSATGSDLARTATVLCRLGDRESVIRSPARTPSRDISFHDPLAVRSSLSAGFDVYKSIRNYQDY